MPDVTEINTRSCSQTGLVGFTLIGKVLRQYVSLTGFGRKLQSIVSPIREGLGDAPAYIGLTDIGYRLVLQSMLLMEKETALEIGKFFKLGSFVGQSRSSLFNIL